MKISLFIAAMTMHLVAAKNYLRGRRLFVHDQEVSSLTRRMLGFPLQTSKWSKKKDKYCAHVSGTYVTLADAKDACLKMGAKKCSGVFDANCDRKGKFSTCKSGLLTSGSTNCVYKPPTTSTTSVKWSKKSKQDCAGKKINLAFSKLVTAQKACLYFGKSKCSGVYGTNCNADGKYYMCKPGGISSSSSNDRCVYFPKTKATTTPTPTTTTTTATTTPTPTTTTTTTSTTTIIEFTKQTEHTCKKIRGLRWTYEFNSLESAQAVCLKFGAGQCSGVLKSSNNHYLCEDGTVSSSTIYDKKGESVWTPATDVLVPATTPSWSSQWTENSQKHCQSYRSNTVYDTIQAAQDACQLMGTKCAGIYDKSCDGLDGFYTCSSAAFDESFASCVYTKKV